jgi:hypothetical protein
LASRRNLNGVKDKLLISTRAIFPDKAGGDRVQGIITPVGSTRFEHARRRLGKLAEREVERVSDADVIEYLARGETETRKVLGLA